MKEGKVLLVNLSPQNRLSPQVADAIVAAVEKLLTERRVSLPGAGPSDGHSGWIRFHREGGLRKFGGSR